MDNSGNYFYPEQVMQTVVSGAVKYYVKGTNVEVHSVTMTDLVKPINGGRVVDDGTKAAVVGTTPTSAYVLKSSMSTGTPIRFTADQVVPGTGSGNTGKFYIAGLAESTATEVVALPATFKVGETIAIDEGVSAHNLTGDPRIDNV